MVRALISNRWSSGSLKNARTSPPQSTGSARKSAPRLLRRSCAARKIRDLEDQLSAHSVSVGWGREGDRWLVGGWFAPCYEQQPISKHIEDDGRAPVFSVDRGVKNPDVPVATCLGVGYDEQMGESRRRKALHIKQATRLVTSLLQPTPRGGRAPFWLNPRPMCRSVSPTRRSCISLQPPISSIIHSRSSSTSNMGSE